MRKFFIVLIFSFTIGVILSLMPKGSNEVLFGFVSSIYIFFLIPIIAGILLVLIQDENKVYKFLPILIIGSLINSLTVILAIYLGISLVEDNFFNLFAIFSSFIGLFYPLVGLSLLGGLIGLVIKGGGIINRRKWEKIRS